MSRDIKLTAYNQETESYRIDRLNQVVGYVSALADHYGNADLFKKVVSLHDHKGELAVEWKVAPSEGEKEFFAKAWANSCEPPENIVHKIVAK